MRSKACVKKDRRGVNREKLTTVGKPRTHEITNLPARLSIPRGLKTAPRTVQLPLRGKFCTCKAKMPMGITNFLTSFFAPLIFNRRNLFCSRRFAKDYPDKVSFSSRFGVISKPIPSGLKFF